MELSAARSFVDKRISERAYKSPRQFIEQFFNEDNRYNYNAVNSVLLAFLHEVGLNSDFVDIGANVGDTAMGAAEALEVMSIPGHVHTFEPGPVFELARANVALNKLDHRTTVYHIAASDSAGYLPMEILSGHTESGSVGGISRHYDLPLVLLRHKCRL